MNQETNIETKGSTKPDFSAGESVLLAMRVELMVKIREAIVEKGWRQVEAAQHLGISQSRVSNLVRGKREKFSLDMLVLLATRAGRHVELAHS